MMAECAQWLNQPRRRTEFAPVLAKAQRVLGDGYARIDVGGGL